MNVFSFGGGVQSTAALVLAAKGEIPYDTFLFANVGDDSEHPATLHYVRTVAIPYAHRNGIDLHTLNHRRRDGRIETLWDRLMRPGSKSLPIPVRMSNGAPGTRSCTADFKIRVIEKHLRHNGATRTWPATVGVGISLDEIHRANNRGPGPYEKVTYPLLDLGLRRTDCMRIIAGAGLPVPPKSACFFCPLKPLTAWQRLREDEPQLFDAACRLETTLIQRRAQLGKDPVFLTRLARPLAQAVPEGTEPLPFDDDSLCESGWCMT
ncbi:phosphoadenosine phosphosulfate reductase [Streptomyces sp. NPDC006984]|uniref:phosphoadenosine phosphosulfate reductase n=1 Tax=Streptomyces sp. NPDC006984 TaxID=3155463 RepID=UPI0033D37FC1